MFSLLSSVTDALIFCTLHNQCLLRPRTVQVRIIDYQSHSVYIYVVFSFQTFSRRFCPLLQIPRMCELTWQWKRFWFWFWSQWCRLFQIVASGCNLQDDCMSFLKAVRWCGIKMVRYLKEHFQVSVLVRLGFGKKIMVWKIISDVREWWDTRGERQVHNTSRCWT